MQSHRLLGGVIRHILQKDPTWGIFEERSYYSMVTSQCKIFLARLNYCPLTPTHRHLHSNTFTSFTEVYICWAGETRAIWVWQQFRKSDSRVYSREFTTHARVSETRWQTPILHILNLALEPFSISISPRAAICPAQQKSRIHLHWHITTEIRCTVEK